MKEYLTFVDMMELYDCGESYAKKLIRSIREYVGGGELPEGKVLPREWQAWKIGAFDERDY